MSIDVRTRLAKDVRALERDELLDAVLVDAMRVHGDLAGRGSCLPGAAGARSRRRRPCRDPDVEARHARRSRPASTVPASSRRSMPTALSDLVQDLVSTMGLCDDVARADHRRLDQRLDRLGAGAARAARRPAGCTRPGDVTFVDADGGPLDLDRTFTIDDDRDEMAHFLEQAGFLHLRGVFDESEMAALGRRHRRVDRGGDARRRRLVVGDRRPGRRPARARPVLPREVRRRCATLVADERYPWIGGLTGDGHVHRDGGEGLVKPLGIVRGLSDLPWHKDCGQGNHSYECNSLTCGISVTGADRVSGALGVIPGSHRANTMATGRDPRLDLGRGCSRPASATSPCTAPTRCTARTRRWSDRAWSSTPTSASPAARRRAPAADPEAVRAQRAGLSDVQSRIEASDNDAAPDRYRAGRGH